MFRDWKAGAQSARTCVTPRERCHECNSLPTGTRLLPGIALPFDQVTATLGKIAVGLGAAIAKAKPNKASVELGLELGLESGALVTLIARGTGTANLKVTLEWGGS